jgi:VCBS repeat-containing protein
VDWLPAKGTGSLGAAALLAVVLVLVFLPPPAVAQTSVPRELDLLCVENDDKVVQATRASDCGRRQRVVDIPATRPVHLCGRDDFGLVRYTTDPAACTRDHEFPITIPDGGPVILCSKNIKNGRLQPTGELRFADDVARCDSRDSTPFITPAAPVATADAYTVDEDTRLVVAARGVLDNDADASGGPLTARLATPPAAGQLQLAADGALAFDPRGVFDDLDAGQSRDVRFSYTTSDGELTSAPASVTITVTGRNDRPVAVADGYTTDEDTALQVVPAGVLGNDRDVEPGALSAHLVRDVAAGALALTADGGLRYDPSGAFEHLGAGATAEVGFTYVARDGSDDSAPAAVAITVRGVDDAPVAVDDARTTDENTALVLTSDDLVANDADAEGRPLTAVDVVAGSPVDAFAIGDGSVRFDPSAAFDALEAGQTGTATLTYAASDGTLRSARATLTITVTGISPPRAVDDGATTDEDTPVEVAVLANDGVADGVLTADPRSRGGAAVAVADGVVTYDPRGAWDHLRPGDSRVDTFGYALEGAEGRSSATVRVVVEGRNDAPVAVDDAYGSVSTGAVRSVAAADGVLFDDVDADRDPADTLRAVLVSPPDRGRLTLRPDGSFDFDPAGELAAGGSVTFRYRTSDGTAESGTATVVLDTARDFLPQIDVETIRIFTDQAAGPFGPVRASDGEGAVTFSLPQGDPHFTIDPATGAVGLRAGLPPPGTYSLLVRVTDSAGQTADAVIPVVVSIRFDPRGDAYRAVGGTPLVVGSAPAPAAVVVRAAGGVLDNDGDLRRLSLQAGRTTTELGGQVDLASDGSFTYLPPRPRATAAGPCDAVPSGWSGGPATDRFTYTVTDDESGRQVQAEVTLSLVDAVWYVDPAAPAPGCGTAVRPYADTAALSGLADLDGPGEAIAVLGGTTASGLVLEQSQRLVGRGADLVAGDLLLLPADPAARPALGGTLQLAPGVDVRGLDVAATGAAPTAGVTGAGADGARVRIATVTATGPALDLAGGTADVELGSATTTTAAGPVLRVAGTAGRVAVGSATGPGAVVDGAGAGADGVVSIGTAALTGAAGLLVTGWDGQVTAGTVTADVTGTALQVDHLPAAGQVRVALLRDPAGGARPTGGVRTAGNRGALVVDRVDLPDVDLSTSASRGLQVLDNDGTVVLDDGLIAAAPPARTEPATAPALAEVVGGAGTTRDDAVLRLAGADLARVGSDARALVVADVEGGGRVVQAGQVVDRGAGIVLRHGATGSLVSLTGGSDVATTASEVVVGTTAGGQPIREVRRSPALVVDGGVVALTGAHRLSADGAPAVRVVNATAGAAGVRIDQATSTAPVLVPGSPQLTGVGIDLSGVVVPSTTTFEVRAGTITAPARAGARIVSSPRVVLGAVSIADVQAADPADAPTSGIGVELVRSDGAVLRGTRIDRTAGDGVVVTDQGDVTLEGVTVRDGDGRGVVVPDAGGTTRIVGSTIAGSLLTGLDVDVLDTPDVADGLARLELLDSTISGTPDEVDAATVSLDGEQGDLELVVGGPVGTAVLGGRDAVAVSATGGADLIASVSRTRAGSSARDALSFSGQGTGTTLDLRLADLDSSSSGGLQLAGRNGLSVGALGGATATGSVARLDVGGAQAVGVLLDGVGHPQPAAGGGVAPATPLRLDQVRVLGPDGTGVRVRAARDVVLDRVVVEGAPEGHGVEVLASADVTITRTRVDLRALGEVDPPAGARPLQDASDTCTGSALALERGPTFIGATFVPYRPPLIVDGVSGIHARNVTGALTIADTTVRGATLHQITAFNGVSLPGVADPAALPPFAPQADGTLRGTLVLSGLTLLDVREARAGVFAGAGAGGAMDVRLDDSEVDVESGLVLCAVDGAAADVATIPGAALALRVTGRSPALVIKASGQGSRATYDLQDVTVDYDVPPGSSAGGPGRGALQLVEEDGGEVDGLFTTLTVIDAPGSAIVVATSGRRYEGLRVVDAAGAGVVVQDVEDVELVDVDVRGSGGDGVLVTGSRDVDLTAAVTAATGGAGLRVVGSDGVRAVDVATSASAGPGLDLQDSTDVAVTTATVQGAAAPAAPRPGVRLVDVLPASLLDVGVVGFDGTPVDVGLGLARAADPVPLLPCPAAAEPCAGALAIGGLDVAGGDDPATAEVEPAVRIAVGSRAAASVRLQDGPSGRDSALGAPLRITGADTALDVAGDGATIASTSAGDALQVRREGSGALEVALADVDVRGAAGTGIAVQDGDLSVLGGVVGPVGGHGLVLTGSGALDVRGTTVRSTGGAGILASLPGGSAHVGPRDTPDGAVPTTVDRAGGIAVDLARAGRVELRGVEVLRPGDRAVRTTDVADVDVEGLRVDLVGGDVPVAAAPVQVTAPLVPAQCTRLVGNVLDGVPDGVPAFSLTAVGLSGYRQLPHPSESVEDWLGRNGNTPATAEALDVTPC